MAFKKIDKEFLLTDSSINVYGFRLLTSGFLLDEFKKNPIGYHMHYREEGVLVKWEDFRLEGDSVFAKPVINLSHWRGERVVQEIEDGFWNGASVGMNQAIELSDDPAFMLPGQTGPTVTKWFCRECSLVDIPGNFNSLALYDKDGQEINLADFKLSSTKQTLNMKIPVFTPAMIKSLNLADTSDQVAAEAAFQDLVDKAAKADTYKGQLDQALSDKQTAETNLANLQKETANKEVTELLETALADSKITKALSDTLATQYEGKPTELKAILDNMQPYKPITAQLADTNDASRFTDKTYSQLDKEGLLPALKASNPTLFAEKFEAEYGVKYKG